MSETLGFSEARVDSLPWEAKRWRMLNARILEAAAKTPTPQVTERYRGRPAGIPAVVESLPGGAVAVTVNSLGPDLSSRWVGPDSVDRFAINQQVKRTFHEFAGDVGAALRIREMGPFPGGDPTAIGSRPNDDFGGYPHRPSHYPRGIGGYTPWRPGMPRPRDSPSSEVVDHPGRSCRDVHGGRSHADWADEQGEIGESAHRRISVREVLRAEYNRLFQERRRQERHDAALSKYYAELYG